MEFSYILIALFAIELSGGTRENPDLKIDNKGGVLELRTYDTWEMCVAAASASNGKMREIFDPQNLEINIAYMCIAKPD